ncbi:MAG: hypothetical protein HY899_18430, partial [Deltaproteobacteria bacterium]|nr:hypothetical protein [Deltaproteobacteria bacterium]
MTRRERGESRFSKDGGAARLRKWWAWSALLCALAASWGLAPGVVAQDAAPAAAGTAPGSAGPAYKSASEQEQLELLRRLLGVEAPVTKPAPEPVPQPVPEPAKVEAPAVPAPAPEPAKVEAPAPEPVKVETPASPAPA